MIYYCNIGLKDVVFFEFICFYLGRVEQRDRNTRKDRISVFICCQITITWQWNKRLRFCQNSEHIILNIQLYYQVTAKSSSYIFPWQSKISETFSCTVFSVSAIDPVLWFLKALPFAGFRFHCGNLDVGQMPL